MEVFESMIHGEGGWNNWNNFYIYTIGQTIPTKVGKLSIIKCTDFGFWFTFKGNYKATASKFRKINTWRVKIRAGGGWKSQKLKFRGDDYSQLERSAQLLKKIKRVQYLRILRTKKD